MPRIQQTLPESLQALVTCFYNQPKTGQQCISQMIDVLLKLMQVDNEKPTTPEDDKALTEKVEGIIDMLAWQLTRDAKTQMERARDCEEIKDFFQKALLAAMAKHYKNLRSRSRKNMHLPPAPDEMEQLEDQLKVLLNEEDLEQESEGENEGDEGDEEEDEEDEDEDMGVTQPSNTMGVTQPSNTMQGSTILTTDFGSDEDDEDYVPE